MRARTKFVRTTPRKIRLILDAIRGLPAVKAESQLQFMPNQSAHDVKLTLHSAISNAKDKGLDVDTLVIAKAFCDEGPRLKRRIIGSRGRARPIAKQMSHIDITLAAQTAPAKTKAPAKTLEEPTKEASHGA